MPSSKRFTRRTTALFTACLVVCSPIRQQRQHVASAFSISGTIYPEKIRPLVHKRLATLTVLHERGITLEKSDFTTSPKLEEKNNTPMHMIIDERKEFELNLGKAVDTLRKDYPKLLTESPDFSIFHEDLEVVDPSGVTIHGISNYKTSFRVVRSLVSFFYCPELSGLTFKLVYDWARNNIRVSWNAELIPRSLYGGYKNKLHVDGISVYDLNRSSGLITQHRIEHLLINSNPVHAPRGVFHALTNEVALSGMPVPGGFGSQQLLEFRKFSGAKLFKRGHTSSLFASSPDSGAASIDGDAFERKNASRKKFGLKPLSAEEFMEIEQQVKQLDVQQKQKLEQMTAASEMEMELKEKKKKNNFLSRMIGDALTDGCTSNYDCERPQVCCDFGFKKICCASGMKVLNGMPQMERATVPVVAGRYPRGGPDGMDNNNMY